MLVMCLAIPSKIIKIEDNVATIDVEGVQRKVSLLLLEDAMVGEYVIVHAGFAIQSLRINLKLIGKKYKIVSSIF